MAKKKVAKKKVSKKKVVRKKRSAKSVATRFSFGNSAWKARSTHGRNPIFESPEHLYEACGEYFQWVEDNPLIAAESVKFQGIGKTMMVPKMRAMTITGLCNFLDISFPTWKDYKSKPDFSDICARVENIIYQQKLEGAAADMLNHAIIARELGLTEKKEVDHKNLPDVSVYLPDNNRGDVDDG